MQYLLMIYSKEGVWEKMSRLSRSKGWLPIRRSAKR